MKKTHDSHNLATWPGQALLHELEAMVAAGQHPGAWALEAFGSPDSPSRSDLRKILDSVSNAPGQPANHISLDSFVLKRAQFLADDAGVANVSVFCTQEQPCRAIGCVVDFVGAAVTGPHAVTVTDLPQMDQWMNCFREIVASHYDNREVITVQSLGSGNPSKFEIAGKGFSRVTAMLFAVMRGAAVVDAKSIGNDEKLKEDVENWKQFPSCNIAK